MVSHRRGGQLVNESPAEGRVRGGASSRLPEESRWERRLPPLQRAGARPRSGRPRPPGELSIRIHVARPAVGEKREDELPPSSQQRPVVVNCLVKTECSSRSSGSPTTSVRECLRRRSSTTFASVRECLVPCHSMRSPKNHRRSISIDAGRNYRIIFNFNFNLS